MSECSVAWRSRPLASALAITAALVLLAVACSSDPSGPAAAPDPDGSGSTVPFDPEAAELAARTADASPIELVDAASDAGLVHEYQGDLRMPPDCLFNEQVGGVIGCTSERMTGGVAVGDYDGDGLDDLFFTQRDDGGVLYRNNGDGTFTDVTAESGIAVPAVASGAGFADLDNNGHQDLAVTTIGADRFYLFMNNGDGTFTEAAVERGFALPSDALRGGQSVAFGDYDNDGWLDIHLTEWLDGTTQSPEPSPHARLLRNRGAEQPGYFDDVTEEAGVVLGTGRVDSLGTASNGNVPNYSFASAIVDLDGDGWPDLVVASDYGVSQLFWNNGDGTFTEGTDEAGFGTEGNAMGLAIADVDGDGHLDVFITAIFGRSTSCTGRPCEMHLTGNRLYLNNGDRTFTEAQGPAGVTDGAWGWGAAMVDLDNDGLIDIAMVNGLDPRPDAELEQLWGVYLFTPPRVWLNEGDGTFLDVAAAAGATHEEPTTGLAVMDVGGDGNLDLLAVRNSGPPVLWRNSGAGNDWLRVEVSGTDSNRDAVGAVVEVTTAGGATHVRHIGIGTHFLGQSERTAHIGLGGGGEPVREVRVRFPATGREVVETDIAPSSTVRIVEPSA